MLRTGAHRCLLGSSTQAVAGPSRLPPVRFSSDEPKSRAAAQPSSSSSEAAPKPPPPSQSTPPHQSSSSTSAQEQPIFSTSQSHYSSEQDKLPLPWLDRPLGVATKPTRHTPAKSSSERAKTYLESGRAEERRRLVQSATQGYFHDFHSLRSHGGKTWRAPNTLIRSDRARWFPNVEGTCLKDKRKKSTLDMCEGKVSVVTLLTSKISEVSGPSMVDAGSKLRADRLP